MWDFFVIDFWISFSLRFNLIDTFMIYFGIGRQMSMTASNSVEQMCLLSHPLAWNPSFTWIGSWANWFKFKYKDLFNILMHLIYLFVSLVSMKAASRTVLTVGRSWLGRICISFSCICGFLSNCSPHRRKTLIYFNVFLYWTCQRVGGASLKVFSAPRSQVEHSMECRAVGVNLEWWTCLLLFGSF